MTRGKQSNINTAVKPTHVNAGRLAFGLLDLTRRWKGEEEKVDESEEEDAGGGGGGGGG